MNLYLLFILIYAFLVATRGTFGELGYFALVLLGLIAILRPKRKVFRHLGFLLGFEGILFMMALFNPGEMILSTPIGEVTREGVYSFFMLLGKAFLSSSTVVIVSSSVGFSRILAEMEALKVPRILVLTMAFTYRYLDLFKEESFRIKKALDSRAFGIGKVEYYRMLGALMGEIFVRAYLRSGRIYNAMLSRGFGEFPKFERVRCVKPIAFSVLALLGVLL